jgi:hypothetical protein
MTRAFSREHQLNYTKDGEIFIFQPSEGEVRGKATFSKEDCPINYQSKVEYLERVTWL